MNAKTFAIANLTDAQLKTVKGIANDVYQEIGFDIPQDYTREDVAECVGDASRMEAHCSTEDEKEAVRMFRLLPWRTQLTFICNNVL